MPRHDDALAYVRVREQLHKGPRIAPAGLSGMSLGFLIRSPMLDEIRYAFRVTPSSTNATLFLLLPPQEEPAARSQRARVTG